MLSWVSNPPETVHYHKDDFAYCPHLPRKANLVWPKGWLAHWLWEWGQGHKFGGGDGPSLREAEEVRKAVTRQMMAIPGKQVKRTLYWFQMKQWHFIHSFTLTGRVSTLPKPATFQPDIWPSGPGPLSRQWARKPPPGSPACGPLPRRASPPRVNLAPRFQVPHGWAEPRSHI